MAGIGNNKIERALEEEQREQKEEQLKWYHYLISILIVLVGAVFIAYKDINIPFICRFVSFVFVAAGIVSILSYCIRDVAAGYYKLDLVYGVMAIFLALVVYTRQETVEEHFPILVGIVLFANGVIKLQHSIDMKRIDRKMKKITEMWLVVMIFALMCIAAGTIAIYLTPSDNRTLFLFVGIALVAAGASDVFTHIVFNRKVKIFKSGRYISDDSDRKDEKPAVVTENTAATEETVAPENINVSEETAVNEEVAAAETKNDTEDVETAEETEDIETAEKTEDAETAEKTDDVDQQA